MGCKVGLEQFGSGLDSFQLLAHFQPAFLKLDSSFTADPALAKEQLEKTQEITARAQSADIRTIAEFVTDAATMSLLFSAGVDYVEGDFVGPPTAQMDFEFN
ncbi:Cyclic di-GMP phosphodiesterase YfgF [compost metagenome]